MLIGVGIGTGFTKKSGGPSTIVSDPFTRADAASLGNAETGQAWTVLAGTWSINTNTAQATTGGMNLASVNSGKADATVSVNVTSGGNDVSMIVRASDASNYIALSIRSDGFAQFYKVVAGSSSAFGSGTFTYTSGVELKIVLSGSTIQAYTGGTLRWTVTDAFNQTVTNHGMGSNFTGTSHDNFKVTA